MKKTIRRPQEKSDKVQECLNHIEITPAVQPRSSAFEISKNTSSRMNVPRPSAQRRQLETCKAVAEVNGGTVENRTHALDGMISTVLKYGKIAVSNYFCSKR